MPIVSGVITRPIGVATVANVLGSGNAQIGALCVHQNINKWSRFKPFRSTAKGYTTKALREAALQAVNFGLSCTPYQPATGLDLLTWLEVTQNWDYNKPRGYTYTEFCRLEDFEGYAHTEIAPMQGNGTIVFQRHVSTRQITLGYTLSGGDDGIGISELSALSNYYAGMIFRRSGSSTRYIITSGTTIGNEGMSFTLSNSAPFNADFDWEYNVICSSVPFTTITAFTDSTAISNTPSFLPAPFASISDSTGDLIVYYPASTIDIEIVPLIDNANTYTLSIALTSDGKVNSNTTIKISAIQMTNEQAVYNSYSLSTPLDITIPAGSKNGVGYVDNSSFSSVLRLVSGRKLQAVCLILSGDDLDLNPLETLINF